MTRDELLQVLLVERNTNPWWPTPAHRRRHGPDPEWVPEKDDVDAIELRRRDLVAADKAWKAAHEADHEDERPRPRKVA